MIPDGAPRASCQPRVQRSAGPGGRLGERKGNARWNSVRSSTMLDWKRIVASDEDGPRTPVVHDARRATEPPPEIDEAPAAGAVALLANPLGPGSVAP